MKFIKYFLIMVALTIVAFSGTSAYADYEFIENPPKFYLAKNHVYLEIESTQFTKDDFSKLSYIYVNPPGEEYEFGLKEYNGSDVCKIARQDSSTTYFHCELESIPSNTFERLVVGFEKKQGATDVSRLLVGYKNTPSQKNGLPKYSKTFVYSNKFNDSDKDGFDDAVDDCPYVENPDQDFENDCPSSFSLNPPNDEEDNAVQQNGVASNPPCGSDPTAAACDVDSDKIFGANDACPLDAEVYSDGVTPTDGVKDGCPGSALGSSPSGSAPLSGDAASGSCSMVDGRTYGINFTSIGLICFIVFVIGLRLIFMYSTRRNAHRL